MKNKGFTLIELLAVILILAIVALIAVPIVSNVINESKEKAAKVTAQNYVKAIEDKIAKDKLLGRKNFLSGRTYQVEEDTELIDKDNGNVSQIDGETVLDIDSSFYLKDVINVKGNAPTDGYIVCEDSKVEEVAFIINGLLVTGTKEQIKNGTLDVDKFSGSSNIASVGISNPKSGLLGGETHQLNVTVTTTDGQEPGKKTKYSSSNTSVATISNKGLITAVNEGTTTITVKAGMKRATFILTVYNGSLLGYVGTLETSGIYQTTVNNVTYDLNVIVLNGNQTISSNTNYGTLDDCASGTGANQMAKRMVVVKVNGDYTVNSGVTVGPIYNEYGGPKGFMLYVTGTLTNNGTIDNSHGAYATGENVYLWKNANNTYEYVPAQGGVGGIGLSSSDASGNAGTAGAGRQTGGGGSGTKESGASVSSGAGGTGTSYSGGPGGGGTHGTTNALSGSNAGGAGGRPNDKSYSGGGGAGNPGGARYTTAGSYTSAEDGANGTGGLLIIYAGQFSNVGMISANGYNGGKGVDGYANGGGSGAGSINIFTDQPTNIDRLGIVTNTLYSSILGSTSVVAGIGGNPNSSSEKGGNGGQGTVNIGEIRNGQYYDLKQIIEQDKERYKEGITLQGDSILSILQNTTFAAGESYYFFTVNGQSYPVHLYTYNGDQNWSGNMVFGNNTDCASGESSDKMAQNMVVVKVNGNLTNTGTINPYYNEYGGPKGFTLYVTGTLTNNGTIDNSHGAYATGENVYLWKNANNTYEYVPAQGGVGGIGLSSSDASGNAGTAGAGRQTGGGGSGTKESGASVSSGAGGTGTSYSGGPGGGGTHGTTNAISGSNAGGAGGRPNDKSYSGGGGAGNPGGLRYTTAGYYGSAEDGANGTGGLLIIYANNYVNSGIISANGYNGGKGVDGYGNGGGSGGGSINIFYHTSVTQGSNVSVTGGLGGNPKSSSAKGGNGGNGTVTYTQIN